MHIIIVLRACARSVGRLYDNKKIQPLSPPGFTPPADYVIHIHTGRGEEGEAE